MPYHFPELRVPGLFLQPVVRRGEPGLPLEPAIARRFGEELLPRESHLQGESQRAFADEKDVVRPLHDHAGDAGGVLDVLETPHGAGAAGEPVHDAGVQLDLALLVGQAAVSDAHVLGILLDDVHAGNDGVERLSALLQDLHGTGAGLGAVGAGNDGGERRSGRLRHAAACLGSQEASRYSGRRGHLQKFAALQIHAYLQWLGGRKE